jgi:hypothetical protein
MGYKVVEDLLLHPSSSKNCPVYNVFENRTETKEKIFIKQFMDREEAKKFSRHLNLGGGFDGWTPTFFLTEVDI